MADKLISELSNYYRKFAPNARLRGNDLFVVSHSMTEETADDFVTFNVQLSDFESQLSSDIKSAISANVAAGMASSGSVAQYTPAQLQEELDLGDLAHEDKVIDRLIDPANKLTLTASITGYHDLALSDEVDLQLSALAHKNVVCLDVFGESSGLSGLLPLERIGYGNISYDFKDLISTASADLKLSALAHKDKVGPADLTGQIDFATQVTNYVGTLDPHYKLLSATDSTLGGLKVGASHARQADRNYDVMLDDTGHAFVNVPWHDERPFGDLAHKDEAELMLSALAHKDKITPADLNGKIDFATQVANYVGTLDPLYKLLSAADDHLGGIKAKDGIIREAKSYDVFIEDDGHAFVNVPWHDTVYEEKIAGEDLGCIRTGYVSTGKKYAVQVDSDGKAFVEVNWSNPSISDLLKDLIGAIYPVGALYLTVAANCPFAELGIGTWEKLPEARCLWTASTTQNVAYGKQLVGQTLDAGIPSHYHTISVGCGSCSCSKQRSVKNFHNSGSWDYSGISAPYEIGSAVYGRSKTVQPSAFCINVFRRIA